MSHWQRAALTFVDAFLGSMATLIASSRILEVNVEGEVLPDIRLIAQMCVSALISALVVLVSYGRALIAESLESE